MLVKERILMGLMVGGEDGEIYVPEGPRRGTRREECLSEVGIYK